MGQSLISKIISPFNSNGDINLIKKDHTCIMYDDKGNFKWCKRTTCINDRLLTLEEAKAINTNLRKNGHECSFIVGMGPNRYVTWCGFSVCENFGLSANMEKENKEKEDFAKSLTEAGHRCVRILESYPCQIDWCEQQICTEI